VNLREKGDLGKYGNAYELFFGNIKSSIII